MENNDEKILIEAGLSEEQAAVYASLIEKGPQKASSLSRWTGIKRGLIYKVLEQLEVMGLLSKKGGEGTVAVFSPEHPSNLADMMERKARAIELAKETVLYSLGSLSSKYNLLSGKPNVQFYEGKNGLKEIYSNILMEGKDILLIRSPHDNKHPEIFPLVEKQINDQSAKGIHTRAITPVVPDTKISIENSDKKNLVERRLIKLEHFNEPAQIVLYGTQKVAITSFEENMISTIIDDRAIYQAFRSIFEFMWLKAKDDHDEILKNLQ